MVGLAGKVLKSFCQETRDTLLPLPLLPSRISLGLSFFQLHNGPKINRITWTRRCKIRNKKVPLFIWYTQCEPSTGAVRPCHWGLRTSLGRCSLLILKIRQAEAQRDCPGPQSSGWPYRAVS